MGERKKLCSVIAIMVIRLIMNAALSFMKRLSLMMQSLTTANATKMMDVYDTR